MLVLWYTRHLAITLELGRMVYVYVCFIPSDLDKLEYMVVADLGELEGTAC